jgi:NitT/TauT family transport system permease protein
MRQELLIAGTEAGYRSHERRQAVGQATRKVALPIVTAAIFLLLWELLVDASRIGAVLLPPPSAILKATWVHRDVLMANAVPTALESIAGFALSVILGGLLGVLLVYSRPAADALYPNVILFQLVPKVAVAPLFILWFGIGWESRLAIALFIAFFPIVISTVSGLKAADPNILRLCNSLTATRSQVFFRVRLPYSLPFLFNGMKISMTLAIIGVIVGEFVTSQSGLGYIILFAGSQMETTIVMAALLMLCIVGLVLYGLVAVAEKLLMRRFGD